VFAQFLLIVIVKVAKQFLTHFKAFEDSNAAYVLKIYHGTGDVGVITFIEAQFFPGGSHYYQVCDGKDWLLYLSK
jgi:hypothetical protein